MRLLMFKQITLWFSVNALFPMAIPALFLAIVAWFSDGTFPLIKQFSLLIDSGFYIFSAASLVFSLYEEYDICEKCVGILMQTCVVLLMIATLGMFYKIQNESIDYIENHRTRFYIIWTMTALLSGIIKYKMIKYKNKLAI